jgi:O6-methylguanine-DNA--protein-cysteine methyltransferase
MAQTTTERDADRAAKTTARPVVLDAAESVGCVRFGRRVIHIRAVLDDGREVAFDLPDIPAATPELRPADLLEWQVDILQAIEEVRPGETVTVNEIVKRAGHLPPEGPSGPQRDFIRKACPANGLTRDYRGWRKDLE